MKEGMRVAKMDREILRHALRVYFILGSPNCKEEPVYVLREAIAGGITFFQFREKGEGALTGEEKYALAEEMQFYCKKAEIPFIVNDDVQLALELKADGIHIGQEDDPAEEIRELIGDKILGVSVHNLEEAAAAFAAGADYFGVGPIYPTQTKKDTRPVQGVNIVETLRKNGFELPIVGVGGITPENAAEVIKGGADGVSAISAISLADDIRGAAGLLRRKVEQALKARGRLY